MSLNVYLFFNGNCREAFDYYKSIFGGNYAAFQTFGDGPPDMKVAESDKNKIMHVSLPIGQSVLMGSDMHTRDIVMGENFSISINPGNKESCDALFARLSEGGAVTMPLQKTFWGSYFGTCKDKYGINWMLNLPLDG